MTVSELISLLNRVDLEAPVYLNDPTENPRALQSITFEREEGREHTTVILDSRILISLPEEDDDA